MDYKKANPDLPTDILHQLFVFAVIPRVGKKALEELFERPLGRTPIRHRSWFWSQCLALSGLNHLVDWFLECYNKGHCLHCTLTKLRANVPTEFWDLLCNRYGRRIWPTDWNHKEPSITFDYWTRGGVWSRRDNFGKIIALGEHIDRADWDFNSWTRKLTPSICRQLESEVHTTCNGKDLLIPSAIEMAVAYVRERLPIFIGRKKKAGYKTISWFFQRAVPHPDGGMIHWQDEVDYPKRNRTDWEVLEWLPKQM